MPRITIDIGDYDPNAAPAEGFDNYDGPIPPAGLYRFKTKLWRLKESSAGNTMFFVVLEIDEPAGSDKAQFNGYAMFHNATLTKKSAPFVNAFLSACGVNPADLSKKGAVQVSPDKEEDVIAIGKTKVIGLHVKALTKRETYEGQPKLTASVWHSVDAEDGDSGDDDIFGDDDDTQGLKDGDDDTTVKSSSNLDNPQTDISDAGDDDPWGDDDDAF